MPRIVHDMLELLHRLQEFHDRIPVRDFLGKDIAAAQGTEITAATGTFACGLCQIQEAAVSEIRAFVEMTLIAAGQETFRPVSFAPVVFLDEPVLLELKSGCGNFLRPVQIDSLRVLLETKETHLFRIMKAVQSWVESDSILANELPVIATQSVRMKTITQKKKGIAGLFGKKETVQVPYITNEIQDFNERLTSARDWRNNQMEAYADSLRLQNSIWK